MTPEKFINTFGSYATEYYHRKGIFSSIILAQAALETGWAKFVPVDKYTGKQSFNLFGTKGKGPAGSVICDTKEFYNGKMHTIEAEFCAYNNWSESIADHNKLLLNDRYKPVRLADTYQEAAEKLQQCGYATDPYYAQKLIRIIEDYKLYRFDTKPEHWAQGYIDKLLADGIINTPRDPEQLVKWREFATVINKIL